jgi:hypothetical protein
MPAAIDTSLPWHEHFVKYGFAVLRNQIDPAWCAAALERIRHRHVEGPGKDLPFNEWTTKNVRLAPKTPGDYLLDRVYDHPNVRKIIATMFGTEEVGPPNLAAWNGQIDYQIFLNPFNPDAQPKPLWGGHIDFGGNVIPAFGDAFVMQVALHETEPFGGNITVVPGSHKLVQERAIRNPLTQYPYDFDDFPFTEPYEFVAKPGDVFLMQHLMFHSGNPCVGATHKPRIALHCQVHRGAFLTKADPADPTNPPWVRSFTLNGYHEDPNDEQRYITFSNNKKKMWGYWASEGFGAVRFKVFTWIDGTLRAKMIMPDDSEVPGKQFRFDGQVLRFEQDAELVSDRLGSAAAAQREAASGTSATLQATARATCRSSLHLVPSDPDALICRFHMPDNHHYELTLRKFKAILGRLKDPTA